MNFEAFVQKLLTDKTFRAAIQADPEKALLAAGLHPTPQLVASLQALDWQSLESVARNYNPTALFAT